MTGKGEAGGGRGRGECVSAPRKTNRKRRRGGRRQTYSAAPDGRKAQHKRARDGRERREGNEGGEGRKARGRRGKEMRQMRNNTRGSSRRRHRSQERRGVEGRGRGALDGASRAPCRGTGIGSGRGASGPRRAAKSMKKKREANTGWCMEDDERRWGNVLGEGVRGARRREVGVCGLRPKGPAGARGGGKPPQRSRGGRRSAAVRELRLTRQKKK